MNYILSGKQKLRDKGGNAIASSPESAETGKEPELAKSGKKENHIVYSTESGRVCPDCGRPAENCSCKRKPAPASGDGIVRVRREVKGRRGKTATVIYGLPLPPGELKDLASDLKRKCGTGGSAKDGIIVIQGDQSETLIPLLEAAGYQVKKAGG